MLLQRIYILVLNLIFKITKHINVHIRNAVIVLCCLALAYMYAFIPRPRDAGDRMIFATAMTMIIIVMSVDRKLERIKWDKLIYLPMLLFGAGVLGVCFLHPVGNGYLIYALDLIFIFPALYVVWINRDDHEALYDRIAVAFALMGLAAFIYSLYLAFRGDYAMLGERAVGGSRNPNYLGMTGLSMLLSCEYLILRTDRWLYSLVLAATGGLGLSMIIESVSRAAILGAAASILVMLIIAVKQRVYTKTRIFRHIVKIIIVLAAVSTAFVSGMFIDDIQRSHAQEAATAELTASDTTAETEELIEETGAAEDVSVTDNEASGDVESIKQRMGNADDVESFSSGRVTTWKTYLPYLNLLGNNYNQFKKDHPELPEPRAHNNFIDYAFRCGIPAALIYLIFYAAAGIKALVRLFRCRKSFAAEFMVITITGVYALYAMVEISNLAFTRVIPCLFFLTIAPLMGEKNKE